MFGVRSGAVAFARFSERPAIEAFERTGANGPEPLLAFALQKVVGSSPIIRFKQKPAGAGLFVVLGLSRAAPIAALVRSQGQVPKPRSAARASTAAFRSAALRKSSA
jgi:hypothetical protein